MTTADRFAVLLDIDGTLLDSTYHHALAWSRAFRDLGQDAPMWRIHRAIGMGGDKLVASVLGDAVEDRIGDRLRDAWERHYEDVKREMRALPGAVRLVRRLQEYGAAPALASSSNAEMVQYALDVLELTEDDFAAVTSSDDADSSKPDPDIFGAALEQTGCTRGIVVGDTTYDVTAAARAGMTCIGVLTGGFSRGELQEAGAVLVVDSLTDLLPLTPARWTALVDHPVPDVPDVRPGQ